MYNVDHCDVTVLSPLQRCMYTYQYMYTYVYTCILQPATTCANDVKIVYSTPFYAYHCHVVFVTYITII